MTKFNLKQIVTLVVKILFVAVVSWYLFLEIQKQFQHHQFHQIHFHSNFLLLLVVNVLLWFVNWSLEIVKWQILTRKIEPKNFFAAAKSVFVAVSFGFFTPARLGEIPARAIYYLPKNRWPIAMAASISSFAQLIATVFFGTLALIFFLKPDVFHQTENTNIMLMASVLFAFLVVFYSGLKKAVTYEFFSEKLKKKWYFVVQMKTYTLLKILIISLFRYLVFPLQFFVWLTIFGVEINFMPAAMALAISFFFGTFVPFFSFLEFAWRSGTTVFLLGQYTYQSIEIAFATTFLWILNVAFTAFLGSLFFAGVKINKSHIFKSDGTTAENKS